jgi:hypothetical protein
MVLNAAMKLERAERLKAQPYKRTDDRTGYANELKDKTMPLAKRKVLLKFTQVRSSLEKGI